MNSVRTPLKVAQLVLSLAIGGTEKLVYDLVRRTDRHLVSPVIYCLDDFGEFGEELAQSGYRIHTLNRQPGIDWKLIRRFAAVLRQNPVDVIHAHHYTPFFYAAMTTLICRAAGMPKVPKVVFTEHGIFYPYHRNPKRFLFNPLLCRMADELVTISEYTKNNLIKYENYPKKKVGVLYNGIDTERFTTDPDTANIKESIGLYPDCKVIGIVARLDPVKNHSMLFRAFKKIFRTVSDTYLLVIGDGPEEKRLKSLSESLGIMKNVVFLGARKDVPELLHAFDIFALSSFSEGMSLTLLEAMAAGLPIVATNVGGNPEVVVDKETGYLVPTDDEHEMSMRLIELLKLESKRRKMGQAGRHRVEKIFSLEKVINIYTGLYYKVCGLTLPER